VVFVDILIFMWVLRYLATDVAYAARGMENPRLAHHRRQRVAAGKPARYGLGGFLGDYWHDMWEDARTTRENKRAGRPVSPPPPAPAPAPAPPVGLTTTAPPDTSPPAEQRRPRPRPTPAPAPANGGTMATEATNYAGAVTALAETERELSILVGHIEWSGAYIEQSTGPIEELDAARRNLAEDVKALADQLAAHNLPQDSLAALELVLKAIEPDRIAAMQEHVANAVTTLRDMHAAVTDARTAVAATQSSIQGTFGDAADTVATTGVNPEFLAA